MSAKLLFQLEKSSMLRRHFELALLAGLTSVQKEVKLNKVTELRDCVNYIVPGNKNRKKWLIKCASYTVSIPTHFIK